MFKGQDFLIQNAHSESASASARAINVPATSNTAQSQLTSALPASPSTNRPNQQQHRSRRHRHRQPLDQHINRPLRPHQWTSDDRTWSPSALNRERAAFFDTRVSGRQEIWQTLKAALEVLWAAETASRNPVDILENSDTEADADVDEHNPAVALATAQSILDAADITLPTGDLADGAYDPLGNYYQLPDHVVSDPSNIVSGPEDLAALGETKADLTAGEDTAQDEVDPDRRREEKGKAVVNTRDQVCATIRMSDTSRDLRLDVGKDETVRSIINHILQEIGPRPGHHVRLIFMGKVLRENTPLMTQGWQPGNVINAFVYELPR
ncbi:Ubiquitin domain-containing protein 1 [Cytospora mali]|uniref:Ubiquitin domain-containing protein 1 n=1 Tax=Cytospora mali TaxID=578113 RepID=A0A194VCV3_CYTMA|nr:Ubiquitin domain-containing protein 1 [Valsa mali var. pyri (nom. inval.)]